MSVKVMLASLVRSPIQAVKACKYLISNSGVGLKVNECILLFTLCAFHTVMTDSVIFFGKKNQIIFSMLFESQSPDFLSGY